LRSFNAASAIITKKPFRKHLGIWMEVPKRCRIKSIAYGDKTSNSESRQI
jgi:hypothetical protein